MTHAVAAAGLIVGVPLVDHIILAPDGHYASMLDLGVLLPEGRPDPEVAAALLRRAR
jgi:DNA repair protein RadC